MSQKRLWVIMLCYLPGIASAGETVGQDCMWKGHKLFGDVKLVESSPDVRVKVVQNFADLHVKKVDNFPNSCGKWKIVDSFPDLKVQIVDSFPDITITYVDAFPGLP